MFLPHSAHLSSPESSQFRFPTLDCGLLSLMASLALSTVARSRPELVKSTGIAFHSSGGVVLALYSRESLAEDVGVDPVGGGFSGLTLAHNVADRETVDSTLAEATSAGARIVKGAQDASWGGRSGYFADPDGHLWEVAWAPGFSFAEDGSLMLPT